MQASASGLEAQLTEECTCSICFDVFTDPIQLPCQHTFCRECLSTYAKSRNGPTLACPMCNTVHKLTKPGDISQFPSDLFAKRIVAHLQSQRAAAVPTISATSLAPELTASASAPPMEEGASAPPALPNSSSLAAAGPLLSAPPAELFDPPPKVPLQPDPVSSPSFWARFFGSSSSSSSSAAQEASAAPSAPPESGFPEKPVSSASYASSPPFSSATSSSAPSDSSSTTLKPVAAVASSSAPVASSSLSKTGPLPPPDLAASSSSGVPLKMSKDSLLLSRAPHKTPDKKVAPIAMPPGLMPPDKILLPECQPKFMTEETYMPYVVPESALRRLFHQWKDALWFAKMEGCHYEGASPVLCPAWRLDADITIKYKAVASVRVQQKEKIHIERYAQKGELRIADYVAVFNAVDASVPFADLLHLCHFTDRLPNVKTDQNFFTWLFGSQAGQHKLEDFPAPQGALLDRAPNWYDQWQQHIKDITTSNHPFRGLITSAIAAHPGLRSAEVNISSIQIVGFHRLVISPLRMPAYICNYTLPDESTPYHVVVNAQDGKIFDGGNRPLTGFGGFMRAIFRGSFK